MGGIGSGRYCRWSKTTTIEETKRIDIRFMRRKGMLYAGGYGSLSWNVGGQPAGDIRYSCHADRIVFNYRYRIGGEDWEPVEQVVWFDRTPCHIGGQRLWFICPGCQRRCEVMCLPAKWIACRKCHRVPYRSQCEDYVDRMQSRQQKLEAMLWGDKRRWWRKAKRTRLLAEWERASDESEEAFVRAAAAVLGDEEMRRIFG